MSYSGGVYFEQGTGNVVVPSGKKITVATGGTIEANGDAFVAVEFDSDYFTVSNGEVTLKAEIVALLELIAGIPTEDEEDGETIWNDNGVLKVSSPAPGGT